MRWLLDLLAVLRTSHSRGRVVHDWHNGSQPVVDGMVRVCRVCERSEEVTAGFGVEPDLWICIEQGDARLHAKEESPA